MYTNHSHRIYQIFSSIFRPLQVKLHSKKIALAQAVSSLPVPSSARAISTHWHILIWTAAADYFQFEVLNYGAGELIPARTGLLNPPASTNSLTYKSPSGSWCARLIQKRSWLKDVCKGGLSQLFDI